MLKENLQQTILFYDPFTELHKLFISSILYELQLYNIHYERITTININYNFDNTIIIIFLNPQFLKTNINVYNEFIKISKIFKYKIYYITEPLDYLIDIKVWQEFIKILKPFRLLTYSSENIQKIIKNNIIQPIFKLSPKFNNYLDICDFSIENLKNRNKNNIIFMGNLNENREKYFQLFDGLFIIKNNIWNMDEYQDIMEQNLFFINIHRRNNCKSLEYLRIIPLLANGCIVLSEMANDVDMNELRDYNIYFFERENIIDGYNDILLKINNEISKNDFFKNVHNNVIKFRNNFKYNKNDINKLLLHIK